MLNRPKNLAIVLASRIIQWQNPELIYAEILNKTGLIMFSKKRNTVF
jgi:hypothetical protein